MKLFVTGGLGYIGSHTCVELISAGHDVVVFDNLSNCSIEVIDRVESLTRKPVHFIRGDLTDFNALRSIFTEITFDAVIHFAGLKAVGESVTKPLRYFHNNVTGSVNLCRAMQDSGVKSLVFSSSATVYGQPDSVPIKEDFSLQTQNPYGRSKLMVENVLRDLSASDPDWKIALLRYFNPIGAHPSGLIGEDPRGIPNNLVPYITQVAIGRRKLLSIFGDDYPTPDGTGIRDYIHVMDLAAGHVAAIDHLIKSEPGVTCCNLGTGMGYSVLDILHAFEKTCQKKLPYQVVGRRPGDAAECYADVSLAEKLLGWKAHYDLDAMCAHSWNWQINNPEGYESRKV